ncbi:MAG: hypothetical protein K8R21_13710 [Leptospira sp.]|nr:hypothetical protein [Leptospira sp.]
MKKQNAILIRGTGVIGWPLVMLLAEISKTATDLEIFAEPYTINPENFHQIKTLSDQGAVIVGTAQNASAIAKSLNLVREETITGKVLVIADCSPPGIGDARIPEYNSGKYPECVSFIAQGSEHKFGKQYMFPENSNEIDLKKEKFVHVSTCNTHTLAAILRLLNPGEEPDFFEFIDFTVIRRDADMAKDDPHVTGPKITPPESQAGTHHARLLNELLRTKGKPVNVSSSAITVNSPYMHLTRFFAKTNRELDKGKVLYQIQNDPLLSAANLLSSNAIFSAGRERGLFGRIFSHGVVILPALEIHGNIARGIVATPGDANVIFSTIHAILKALEHQKIEQIMKYLYRIVLKNI